MENINITIENIKKFMSVNSDCNMLNLGENLIVIYLKSLIANDFIIEKICLPYSNNFIDFDKYIKALSYPIKEIAIEKSLTEGKIVVIYNNQLIALRNTIEKKGRSVSEVKRESSYEGGLEAFVENIEVNLNMIRQYYKNIKLELRSFTIDERDNKQLSVVYVDRKSLDKVLDIIKKSNAHSIESLSQLQQMLMHNQWLFPRLMTTERPDRTIMAINKGRFVIFLNGTSTALIGPTNFHEYISAVDDNYLLPLPAAFFIALRYLAIIIGITSPALYVVSVGYNPEIFRVQLALSIASSRKEVPYSAFFEVLFMLIMMEFLVEASLRLPKTIGQTATTVGGLILGQAATAASLVSNIMIIVVAASAISNFIIPISSMTIAVRVLKYIVLLFAILGGFPGLVCFLLAIPFYLSSLNSFNLDYFNPVGLSLKKIRAFIRKG